MKKIIITLSVVMSLAFASTATAQQKFGHVNTQELFKTMPEVATLQTDLKNKSKQYETQLQKLYTQYQTLVEDMQKNAQTYTQMVLEQKYKEAAELEQKITKIEKAAQQELAQYEQTKLAPIEEKAYNAIQKVAKANGYNYVFDSSLGVLIVKPAGDDITNMVKSELGIY